MAVSAYRPVPGVVDVADGGWGPKATVHVAALLPSFDERGLEGVGAVCHHQLPPRMAICVLDFQGVPWGRLSAEAVSRLLRHVRRRSTQKRGSLVVSFADEETVGYILDRHRTELGVPQPSEDPEPGEQLRFAGRLSPKKLRLDPTTNPQTSKRRRATFDALKERDGEGCVWCGVPLELDDPNTTFDHALPASKGGSGEVTNLLLACALCNGSRTDRPLEEWRDVCHRHDFKLNHTAVRAAIRRRDRDLSRRGQLESEA